MWTHVLADLDEVTVAAGQHVVHFYERDEHLALAVSSFLGAGLVAGESVLVVGTVAHREAFDAVLAAAGIDLSAARATGQYQTLDAGDQLAAFMIDGRPDETRFGATVGRVVRELGATGAPVRIYGEMVALLWDEGNITGALAVEDLWNDLSRRSDFTLFCAYRRQSVAGYSSGRDAICEHHSAVVAEQRSQPVRSHEVLRRFQPTLFAAPVARRFVTEALQSWGRHAVVERTEVIVSEMVSNAIRHSGRPFRVGVSLLQGVVRVSVTDQSPQPPTVCADDPEVATGGRGMHLIAALSRRWGTQLHDGGKTVWAEIDDPALGDARQGVLRPVNRPE
jgi:anti-sigma regulatory factor (Ser/Thr protein kinase)